VLSLKNIIDKNTRFQVNIMKEKKENAPETLNDLGIPYKILKLNRKYINSFSGILLMTDWGWVEKNTVKRFQNNGIPTFCLQESVIDFDQKAKRMQWSDFSLIQGIATMKHFHKDIYFLTGNPRYEDLRLLDPPKNTLVAINSNFTYNVHTDVQEFWIGTVVNVCESQNIDYIILQHPRDKADLSKYNFIRTNAKIVHSYLEKSSLLISRFSSVIHECLAMGKPVIYFNPHNEYMYYDFEPDDSHLIMAHNRDEVEDAMNILVTKTIPSSKNDDYYKKYILRHLGTYDNKASDRVTDTVVKFSDYHQDNAKKENLSQSFIMYSRFLRTKMVRYIKNY
jgi:hypothetical protein